MTKAEKAILDAPNPSAYIEASLRSRLAPSAKARLARKWMERTGFSKEDILYARNRHPYWKRRKMVGAAERTKRRIEDYDYSDGSKLAWTAKRVRTFLDLNRRDSAGRYEHRDWELAESFGTSIPSIQYMRRKLALTLTMLGPRPTRKRLVEYLCLSESILSRGKIAVEELRSARSGRGGREI